MAHFDSKRVSQRINTFLTRQAVYEALSFFFVGLRSLFWAKNSGKFQRSSAIYISERNEKSIAREQTPWNRVCLRFLLPKKGDNSWSSVDAAELVCLLFSCWISSVHIDLTSDEITKMAIELQHWAKCDYVNLFATCALKALLFVSRLSGREKRPLKTLETIRVKTFIDISLALLINR